MNPANGPDYRPTALPTDTERATDKGTDMQLLYTANWQTRFCPDITGSLLSIGDYSAFISDPDEWSDLYQWSVTCNGLTIARGGHVDESDARDAAEYAIRDHYASVRADQVGQS